MPEQVKGHTMTRIAIDIHVAAAIELIMGCDANWKTAFIMFCVLINCDADGQLFTEHCIITAIVCMDNVLKRTCLIP